MLIGAADTACHGARHQPGRHSGASGLGGAGRQPTCCKARKVLADEVPPGARLDLRDVVCASRNSPAGLLSWGRTSQEGPRNQQDALEEDERSLARHRLRHAAAATRGSAFSVHDQRAALSVHACSCRRVQEQATAWPWARGGPPAPAHGQDGAEPLEEDGVHGDLALGALAGAIAPALVHLRAQRVLRATRWSVSVLEHVSDDSTRRHSRLVGQAQGRARAVRRACSRWARWTSF